MNTSNWGSGFSEPPQSYWMASVETTDYPSLKEDVKVDVAIVGGGLVGITCAFLLKREGFTVAILEADRILHGTTGHTTAKLTTQHNLIYHKIKTQMGAEKATQYADANQNAMRMVASLVEQEHIDCDFVRQPAFVYTHDDNYIKKIQDEATTAESLGIPSTYVESIPLPFEIKAGLCFHEQAQFHPLKYLMALQKHIPRDGSYIFEQTRALDIHHGKECSVTTNSGYKITASNIIIATHYPFYDGYGFYFTRLFPDRSYALAVQLKDKFPEGMYITAEDPGRSLRSQAFDGGEMVIVGGEHHKTGQGEDTNNHYLNLKDFAEQTFQIEKLLYRWSTQDYTTADEVPYVGNLTAKTPNIYVATGFRKWGMTNGTAAAILIKDLIVKGESPWVSVYNPSRFTLKASASNFVKENADVAKHLVLGKVLPVPQEIDLKPGEGKVIGLNDLKIGAFKDETGKVHFVDTTCPHLGCELQWNSAERSWDCPCHGSRFTYEGEIIEGPALKPLRK